MTARDRKTVVVPGYGPVALYRFGQNVSMRTRAGRVIAFPGHLSAALLRAHFGASTQSLSLRAQGQPIRRKGKTL